MFFFNRKKIMTDWKQIMTDNFQNYFVAESAPPIRIIVETVSLSIHGSVQFIFNCINLFQREKIVDFAATMMSGRPVFPSVCREIN